VKRLARLPIGLIWPVTVLAMWVLTTALLAVLIRAGSGPVPAGALLSQSTISAAFACVVVGGPASYGLGKAALSGLATAVLIMLFIWSYLEASGTSITGAWRAVAPVFVVAVIEMALAFALRGRRVRVADGPEPSSH